ncbi:MAG TPA: cupredoxin domain-containing protein, partial [Blastocatellia bacterium]|nr:cupredoxin domain-containing protein [Blastocatellia bacterium]
AEGMPKFETPVKHLHPLGGCQGTLRIYSDRVTYESADEPKHSRYWRYQDLQRFSHPARYRCSITTFEDKFGGPTGVYDFQLRADLPASAYDYVWVRVNPVELYPYPKAASRDALAANPQVAATAPQPSPIRERQDESKIQTIKVVLDDQGYQPASIELKQGLPARIEFVRRTEGGCGKEILIPEYGIKRELPVNEPVMIEFTPVRSGEYAFTCGMKMLHGKIVVREQPGTPAVVDEMQPREEAPDRKARPSVPRPTVQTAKVVVTAEGYKPDSLRLRRGVPARVTFVRQVEATCGTEIVLPEHGIKRALPLNRPVVVSFVPDKSGEFSFTCGMGMLRGKLIVEEK